MTDLGLTDLILLSVVCFTIALCVIWLLDLLFQRRISAESPHDSTANEAHFLIKDDVIHDHDLPIRRLTGGPESTPESWQDLRSWLGERFGALPETLAGITGNKTETFAATDPQDSAVLRLSNTRDVHRVILTDPAVPDPLARHRARKLDKAHTRFLAVVDNMPCAAAMLDSDKRISWKNARFAQFSEDDIQCLLQALERLPTEDRFVLPARDSDTARHVQLTFLPNGPSSVLYVNDVSEVAQAEIVRREFVQTLTKTFANLTTGLAVFDRHRQLALFNPALLDLTGLPAAFLSGQPPLTQFFDRLRDNKMLPEPRNYGTWRNQIDDMITSAADGLYHEDWHLVNGLIYRVTGRPHPDGAIAFLFEDISDEVAMARQIRIQLDVRQATLDTLDKSIAVIGADRSILFCNRPCCDLLAIDPDASFANMALMEFLSACEERLPQEDFWGTVEQTIAERKTMEADLRTPDGTALRCRVVRMPGKKMKISFIPHLEIAPKLSTEAGLTV
ncbi:PAS-domain containing protein [Roseovarius aestuariivivens]|uniref:PAS-domain containing protein n=1 Tax=Roseovarius aestuariivivens TaxID=1888910 RepID=UPI00108115D5|nr:PAS-domain containing protein [Roseovarius aestuariivivens]